MVGGESKKQTMSWMWSIFAAFLQLLKGNRFLGLCKLTGQKVISNNIKLIKTLQLLIGKIRTQKIFGFKKKKNEAGK